MIRKLISSLLVAVSTVLFSVGMAPDDDEVPAKSKAFKRAEPSKKAVVGTEVVPKPSEAIVLKKWRLDKPGPSAMGVTVYVNEIHLYSDARMRFLLSFWNRSREGQTLYFDFEEMVVADPQSNPFPQLGRNIISGNRGSIYMRTIASDQRFNTWVDYKAPEEPTTTFKVGVMLEGRYDHRADAFKPFLVTLNEPLFLKDGIFQVGAENVPRVRPEDPPGEGAGPGPAGGSVGPMTKGGTIPAPAAPSGASSPRQVEELAEKFRDLSEEGRWLEGDLLVNQGKYHDQVKIAFKKRDETEFVEAMIVSLSGANRKFEVHGAFFTNLKSPSGLALKLRDCSRKVEITLILEGNNLTGKDSDENQYNFILPKK